MTFSVPHAVLFDLDGTLADTAPDLAAAVNKLRTDRGLPSVAYASLRPVASAGARGLINAAFGLGPDDQTYEALRDEFLKNYENAIATCTTLFPGVQELLNFLEDSKLPWGIVTNKPARYTDLLAPQIGLQTASCIISGDTTAHPKPHPAPLLEGAHRLGLPAQECWYVGDDLRDIQAAKAAGMFSVAAAWGYCGNSEPATWNADALAPTPLELIDLIRAHRS